MALTLALAFAVVACGDDDGGGSVEAFCESAEALNDFQTEVGDDEQALVEQADEGREAVDALADDAPDEISDEVNTAADAYNQFLDAIVEIDPADETAIAEAVDPLFNDPEINAASDRVNEFTLAECGFDLEGSDG